MPTLADPMDLAERLVSRAKGDDSCVFAFRGTFEQFTEFMALNGADAIMPGGVVGREVPSPGGPEVVGIEDVVLVGSRTALIRLRQSQNQPTLAALMGADPGHLVSAQI
jgi:hypothetical protein